MEILNFELGDQRCGLLAEDVVEVVRAVGIAPLPKAPAVVEGVINVRGRVMAVLDVRRRFGLPGRPLDPADHFVLAWAGGREVALRVDRATDLVAVDPGVLAAAKNVVPRGEYGAGVAKLPDGLVLIHDLRTFLSEAEAAWLDEALATPETPEAEP